MTMMKFLLAILLVALASAFAPTSQSSTRSSSTTALAGFNTNYNGEFMRWARAKRSADVDDNVVEMMKPLGLVLNQDENGNVYVETVAPGGNAARTGKVCVK